MKTTSHFIGIKLRSDLLSDLYSSVQKSLGSDASSAEFQNPLSTHITLYYLGAELSMDDFRMITESLRGILDFPVTIDGFDYFGPPDAPRLCYLRPTAPKGVLQGLNENLKRLFPGHSAIPENLLPFVPHVTLFKIRDVEAFERNRAMIEQALREELSRIWLLNLYESVKLFKVNSEFRPEIQIAVKPFI